MGNLLSKAGKSFGKGESANQALRAIDAVGRIALGYESELAQPNTPTSFTLPDGGQIDLGAELFDAPEVLFQPDLVGETGVGIHKMIFDSIMACDVDIRKDLFNHVLLSDGFEYEDMAERICLELTALSPESTTIKIVTPPGLEVWFGGAILSSLSTFEEMWIAKSEYDESGPGIVHKRCA